MAVMLKTERRALCSRLIVIMIYLMLALGALSMVYPFMITVASSFTNAFDYDRFLPVPRSVYSRSDRFVRGLAKHFRRTLPPVLFPDRPATWSTWTAVGNDYEGIDTFANRYLGVESDPAALGKWRRAAADYADFFLDYDIGNTVCFYDFRDVAGHLRREYTRRLTSDMRQGPGTTADKALTLLRDEWSIPYPEFFDISFRKELFYPMHHATWNYPDTPKARAFMRFKNAYRSLAFHPNAERDWRRFCAAKGIAKGEVSWPVSRDNDVLWPLFKQFAGQAAPASQTVPFSLKAEWLKYLDRSNVKEELGLESGRSFRVEDYNHLFDASGTQLIDLPFPPPIQNHPLLARTWTEFVRGYYPVRLMELRVTPELENEYSTVLERTFRTVQAYNGLMQRKDPDYEPVASFKDVRLPARGSTEAWVAFARTRPLEQLELHGAEVEWQQYLLNKYGSLAAINRAYGWSLGTLQEARIPFAEAYTISFLDHEWRDFLHDVAGNYTQVFDFLFIRGRAFFNTLVLITLTLLATLTVNPLAAYALSRFNLKLKEQILLFLLATMAFPGAVRAVPGFLLMRDLHLLNTYAALVLPTLANGMSIFILKCFFDGLPRELYEAATIDGAREWQIFLNVTLPLTKPILAINCLNAFIVAYNSWQWALLVCQDKRYWTLAVWLYQMQDTWARYPYVIMAGFVIASIPTAIVFISCQKIILKGIVIPSMK